MLPQGGLLHRFLAWEKMLLIYIWKKSVWLSKVRITWLRQIIKQQSHVFPDYDHTPIISPISTNPLHTGFNQPIHQPITVCKSSFSIFPYWKKRCKIAHQSSPSQFTNDYASEIWLVGINSDVPPELFRFARSREIYCDKSFCARGKSLALTLLGTVSALGAQSWRRRLRLIARLPRWDDLYWRYNHANVGHCSVFNAQCDVNDISLNHYAFDIETCLLLFMHIFIMLQN